MSSAELSNQQLARYSRHLLLPEFDLEGQEQLNKSTITIIGAGGLGGPAALFLASSGVGHIHIYDDDHIDLGNLQRQIAFNNNDLGKNKASQLKHTLHKLNPEIEIHAHNRRTNSIDLTQAAEHSDLILDCCDNFDTRFAINRASQSTKTPLVSGAAIRFQGQASVFDPRQADNPCYHCLYNEEESQEQETCRDRGIFAPLVGIIGSIQAAEALKLLTGSGESLAGKLLSINALNMIPHISQLKKDPYCPVCSE